MLGPGFVAWSEIQCVRVAPESIVINVARAGRELTVPASLARIQQLADIGYAPAFGRVECGEPLLELAFGYGNIAGRVSREADQHARAGDVARGVPVFLSHCERFLRLFAFQQYPNQWKHRGLAPGISPKRRTQRVERALAEFADCRRLGRQLLAARVVIKAEASDHFVTT